MMTKTNISVFLSFICVIAISQENFIPYEQAKQHTIVRNSPAPDFFEGALIGNGGIGVVACTRPDAVMLRFGHNDVWDIRISEDNREEIGTFQEVFEMVEAIDPGQKSLDDDPWYAGYKKMARENYAKPYPRPFPCGSLILGFDRREVEVIGHSLDISSGMVSIKLLLNNREDAYLKIFTDMEKDRVWMRLVDDRGTPLPNCFNRINVIPDVSTPEEFPEFTLQEIRGGISFKQIMPYEEPQEYDKEKGHEKDRVFSLNVITADAIEKRDRIDWNGNVVKMAIMEYALDQDKPFWLCAELRNGLASKIDEDFSEFESLEATDYESVLVSSEKSWADFWSKSGIYLEDKELEAIWYRNLYFFNCAAKSGVNCPGLFANWSFNNIGTAWHGDYHMNYNTQQPFWTTFSSNHLELNEPYVELIEFISEVSRRWAADYYRMRGAFYPHSAYPVDMTMNPYPVPTWGWEIFETPWSVQGVWWHYLYAPDKKFLEERAFPLIKDATEFIIDYMTRPEAHGLQWGDNQYHVFPTVPPELYGLRPGFVFNSDCLVDLTLIKFLFNAYLESVEILGVQDQEKKNMDDVRKILNNYPAYPTAVSDKYGEVFVSVQGESTETVYNVPNNLMTLFPGEDHGLHSDKETKQMLANSKRNSQIEGGNELVFQHLQSARIGMLDLDLFKRAVRYCTLPNGTSADYTLQINGRYSDHTHPQYMGKMGIWFENFGLPAVINECLMQSYNGIIRMFPNWPDEKDAAFQTLRAAGGFLVSGSIQDGVIGEMSLICENDTELQMYNPWGADAVVVAVSDGKERTLEGDVITMKVRKGQRIIISTKQ
ncbi:MAG: hypothetical protein GY790_20085 [Bacteroidetes bacterium]|nr:hypothetical protein [Bacteroidota bacterium]